VHWKWGEVFVPLYILLFLQAILLTLFFAFLAASLDHRNWKAAEILSPLYVLEALNIINRLRKSTHATYISDAQSSSPKDKTSFLGLGYFGFLIRQWFWWLHRVWFLIFLTVQLDGSLHSWWIPAIPLISAMVLGFVLKLADDKAAAAASPDGAGGDDAEDQANAKTWGSFTTCLAVILGSLAMILIGLLATHLDNGKFTMAVVFIPIFIVLGFLVCCCGCCVPCICCCGMGRGDPVSENGPLQTMTDLLAPNRQRYRLIETTPLLS